MKKFIAKTLDAALIEATQHFNCSLTQLEYEIFQNSSGGFLGLMRKDAIIIATRKEEIQQDHKPQETSQESAKKPQENKQTQDIAQTNYTESPRNTANLDTQTSHSPQHDNIKNTLLQNQENRQDLSNKEFVANNITKSEMTKSKFPKNEATRSEFASSEFARSEFDSTLYDEQSHIPWQNTANTASTQETQLLDMEVVCKQIQDELITLFNFLPLDLGKIQVQPYDSHTISILIDGLDAALLIGQKGYRYKSLSYLFFNWINTQYGYGVRLEIAQFLKNQEDMIRVYLNPIIESAKLTGKAQTKPLDGILTHIALKILRDELPNKYIVFRDTADGEKYITISDFLNSTNNNYRNNNNINGFGNSPKY